MSAPLSSPFYASKPTFSPEVQMASEGHHMEPKRKLIIPLIAASIVLGFLIFLIFCLWIYHRKRAHKPHKDSVHSSDVVKGLALSQYMGKFESLKSICGKGCISLMDYKTLESGTNNFQESNILGKGGFGWVYKAKLGENFYAAVKKLNDITPDAIKEFQTEVELLSKMHHPNIISLLGYNIHDETRIIVYELMQNGSLESQLHGTSHGSALTWHLRMKIALDIARALEYLHEHCHPPVIHRDLKSSNILLDASFNAKLSDFGLAIPDGAQNKNNIKLSGTLGYVAPEYLLDGKLTDKSDVYGFGVVLLELLLGKRPVEMLVNGGAKLSNCQMEAMPQLTDRSKLPSIVDPVIKNTMDLKHLHQVGAVAVLCVQPEPSYRPLITDVLHSLIPLVPIEMGGTLRLTRRTPSAAVIMPSELRKEILA